MPTSKSIEAPSRVLIVACGLIGDTVMNTPVIVEARRLWPDTKLTLLGQKHNCELLADCPLLDSIVETPAVPFTLRKRRGVAELKHWLREKKFNLALILLGDQFAFTLARAGIPLRVGVRGHALESCLTHSYEIGNARDWGPSQTLNSLRCLGCEVFDAPPQLWIADSTRERARERLLECGLKPGEPYALIHPFGSSRRQWWPIGCAETLASQFSRSAGLKTVLIGGREESRFARGLRTSALINATGAFTVQELIAVVEGAAVTVTTDSGPFHIAGALGRPVVGLFRARRPEHVNRYPQASVVFGQDGVCQRRCDWNRCRSTPCRQMNAISESEVLNVISVTQECKAATAQRQ